MQQIFIGRQAIYDRAMQLHAYELLYREGNTGSAPQMDGDQASARVILNTFVEIGLERIAGQRKVFLNLTDSFLTEQPSIPFDKDRLVLEILESSAVNDKLKEGARAMAAQGYMLALDDFEFGKESESLVPLVKIVKVEMPAIDWSQIEAQVAKLRRHKVLLLAEKVESDEEYQRLLELGFDLFQGYYFSRPHVVEGTRMSENQLVMLRLLARLNDPQVTPEELEELIRQDPGFSYKILRYLNSAAIGLPRKIESISQAIIYLGLQRLRSWASLISLSQMENNQQELFLMALVRAHMCSLMVKTLEPEQADHAYTVGLLSVLDLLLNQPLAEILRQVPLAVNVKEALLDYHGLAGKALRCALDYEQHLGHQTEFPCLERTQIQELYFAASEIAFREQEALLGG